MKLFLKYAPTVVKYLSGENSGMKVAVDSKTWS